jgi:hypothetical protein
MRVQEIIHAHKDVFDWGKAQQGGMTASVFPMLKRRKSGLRFGGNHRWQLIRFRSLGETFRVLIAYHTLVDNYSAYLGMDVGPDTRLIMEFAYHATHPGWHTHVGCGDVRHVPPGVVIGPWQTRLPNARSFVRRQLYTPAGGPMTDQVALQMAAKRFNLHNQAGDLFGKQRS